MIPVTFIRRVSLDADSGQSTKIIVIIICPKNFLNPKTITYRLYSSTIESSWFSKVSLNCWAACSPAVPRSRKFCSAARTASPCLSRIRCWNSLAVVPLLEWSSSSFSFCCNSVASRLYSSCNWAPWGGIGGPGGVLGGVGARAGLLK